MRKGRFIPLVLMAALASGGCGDAAGAPAPAEADVAGFIEETVRLADQAKRAGNAEPCANGSSEGVRLQCVAIAAEHLRDPALCRTIAATSEEHVELRELCLSDVATVRGEPGLCAELTVPGFRDSCFLEVKRATGDAALCARIADAGLKSACSGEPVMAE